jgi:hypothetical protein
MVGAVAGDVLGDGGFPLSQILARPIICDQHEITSPPAEVVVGAEELRAHLVAEELRARPSASGACTSVAA